MRYGRRIPATNIVEYRYINPASRPRRLLSLKRFHKASQVRFLANIDPRIALRLRTRLTRGLPTSLEAAAHLMGVSALPLRGWASPIVPESQLSHGKTEAFLASKSTGKVSRHGRRLQIETTQFPFVQALGTRRHLRTAPKLGAEAWRDRATSRFLRPKEMIQGAAGLRRTNFGRGRDEGEFE